MCIVLAKTKVEKTIHYKITDQMVYSA